MMFEFSSGKRRTRRNNHIVPSPASIESLETRSLLSAGPVVTIPGAVTGAGGQLEITNPRNPISWTAIPNATSYDVWVSDVESRVRTLLAEGLPSQFQEFTPTADYQLGESRIWVRANFADRTSTNWSTPVEVLLKTTPSLTIASGKVDGNQTPITWTSVNGARAFEIFVSNQTDLSSTVYRVPNQVVARDAAGNAIPDGKGSVLREEVREFYLSGAVTLPATAPRTITDVTNDPEMIISVANHGLKTGEQVRISGVTGNTAANGTWFVTRVDANRIRLRGIAGSGNYTGGGQLVQLTQLRSEIAMAQYKVYVRSVDDAVPGRPSQWSAAVDIEQAPAVQIRRPVGQTFGTPITLEWSAVDQATHYEVLVKRPGTPDSAALFNPKYLQGTSFTLPTTQLITLSFSGTPTSGTFQLQFTIPGDPARTLTTRALPWNATGADIRAAISGLGIAGATVRTLKAGDNPVHEITISRAAEPLQVVALPLLQQGQLSAVSRQTFTDWGSLEYKVRARRLTQVTDVAVSGNPESGTFTLTLKTPGKTVVTQVSDAIPFNATATEVQSVLRKLPGFETVIVRSQGTLGLNGTVRYSIVIPQLVNPVEVTVQSALNQGTAVVERSRTSPEVVGQWSSTATITTDNVPRVQVPLSNVYTSRTPTIVLSKVDQAARYDIWVERHLATTVFLKTTSASNEFTFPTDLPAGRYTLYARAVSVRGEVSKWSDAYTFTCTGGAPVIVDPVNNSSSANPLPQIRWESVKEAKTYEIMIALIGKNFNFLRQSGLSGNTFSPNAPLNAGDYRVWVRGVTADDKTLPWSDPVNFTVT
ncbi:MAG: hypothetical protein ACK5YC_03315 [Planctomyces sp.]